MERIQGALSKLPARLEFVSCDDDGKTFKKLLVTDNELPLSVQAVMSNDDLLIEILLLLPVMQINMSKLVSKRWLSLIKSPIFTLRRSQIPSLEPPSGLFLPSQNYSCQYDFVAWDTKIPPNRNRSQTNFKISTFNYGYYEAENRVHILQSCNGLLLCCKKLQYEYYVYNPSVNLFKTLPPLPNVHSNLYHDGNDIRMAFDPTKSPHYKVVYAGLIASSIQLHIYSSETCRWSVCSDHFPLLSFAYFEDGICLNDAIHWVNSANQQTFHFKFDSIDHTLLTTMQITPLDGKIYYDCKLFDSRGCLLLCGYDTVSRQLNIYEMRNGCSEWVLKYLFNLGDIMMPFPEKCEILKCVWCVVLREKEDDSFIVIDLFGKAAQYKFVLKTLHTLCYLGSVSPSKTFQFIPSFASV